MAMTICSNEHPYRVALFVPTMRGGGAERVMQNLAKGLVDRGVQTDLLLARATGIYLDKIPPGVRVVDFKVDHVSHALMGLVRYLKSTNPQVVLSAMGHTNLVALTARRISGVKAKVFVSVHNTYSKAVVPGASIRKRLIPSLEGKIYPWADGVVAVSAGVADDLAQTAKLPRASISVIYNPIVSEELFVQAKAPVDHPWFRPSQPPVVLSIGRLVPQKDYPTLIRAFALVLGELDARLVILGEGRDRDKLEEMIRGLGLSDRVALPGFVENPFACLARSAVFVLSSAWEGFGNVLVEALALGVPIVSTRCPSGPDEILEGGRLGDLVPVKDETIMARRIIERLKRPNNPEETRQRVERSDYFSVANVTSRYLELFNG